FLNRTGGFITPVAFQEELRAFPATQTTHCISIPSQSISLKSKSRRKSLQVTPRRDPSSFGLIHFDCRLPIADCSKSRIGNWQSAMVFYTRRRLGGRQPLCGIGVVSRMVITRMPALAIARIADSRPPPGPFTLNSHWCIPASCAFLAASYAACCAANGVPLREPRKPRAPADDCAIRLPSRSVIEIMVLLKEAAMCAMPTGTFFFSFLRKTFFFPVAFAITCQPTNIRYRVSGVSQD